MPSARKPATEAMRVQRRRLRILAISLRSTFRSAKPAAGAAAARSRWSSDGSCSRSVLNRSIEAHLILVVAERLDVAAPGDVFVPDRDRAHGVDEIFELGIDRVGVVLAVLARKAVVLVAADDGDDDVAAQLVVDAEL